MPECESSPLGMSSNAIPDTSVTASSFNSASDWDREPKYARLGKVGRFWSSAPGDSEPWIQVDLGSSHQVIGLQTEGYLSTLRTSYWIDQIKVQVGLVNDSLVFIETDAGEPKVCFVLFV